MKPIYHVVVFSVLLILSACGKTDPEAARKKMGLPPQGFVADVDLGKDLFRANCAACHGIDGGGSSKGPPLNHKGYRSQHHADLAFYWAIRDGVTQHHWNFGNMPKLPNVTTENAAHIVAYVRKRQRKSGIE